jgi:hypothetical protein
MKEKCQNCGEKRELSIWVGEGGMLAYTHGSYQMWCKKCILKAQLEHAEEEAKRIPKLKIKLSQLEKSER